MGAGTTALMSADGRSLLIGGNGVRWLDTNSLQVAATALPTWTVTGLAAGADGKTVYAISDSGQIAALDGTGHVLDRFDSGVSFASALFS
jgi:hypothetical protein